MHHQNGICRDIWPEKAAICEQKTKKPTFNRITQSAEWINAIVDDTIVIVCIRIIVATIPSKVQVSSRSNAVAMDPCSVQRYSGQLAQILSKWQQPNDPFEQFAIMCPAAEKKTAGEMMQHAEAARTANETKSAKSRLYSFASEK